MKRRLADNRWHLALALSTALVAGVICLYGLETHSSGAGDYTWVWRAARELRAGQNPYRDPSIGVGHPYPANAPLYYPLPAVLLVLPLSWLPAKLSSAIFTSGMIGLLSFFASRRGRVTWLLVLSPSCYLGVREAQWAPLLVALSLIPGLAAIGAAFKPNLGIALGLSRPNLRAILAAVGLGVLSIAILPTWPLDWLHNLGENRHTAPLQFGLIALPILLAALFWRKPNGRMLLLLAFVPQRLIFYDQLPLFLIPRTIRQQMMMLSISWVGYLFWDQALHHRNTYLTPDDISGPIVLICLFLPALGVMLWQERASVRFSKRARALQMPHKGTPMSD